MTKSLRLTELHVRRSESSGSADRERQRRSLQFPVPWLMLLLQCSRRRLLANNLDTSNAFNARNVDRHPGRRRMLYT